MGQNSARIFVNHIAHVLKARTDQRLHVRDGKNRDAPYHLTEKGRIFFQKYYADRHGR